MIIASPVSEGGITMYNKMYFQIYVIVLNDGTELEVAEDYDLPEEDSLFSVFEETKMNGTITATNRMGETICVPKKNIQYIRMTYVESV